MLQLGGKEFARSCQRQGVELDDALRAVLHNRPTAETGMPTQLLSAIGATSDLLTGMPGEPLSYGGNIKPTARMLLDPVAVHLARIINYSRRPDTSPTLPSFGSTNEELDFCPAAEYYFLDTFGAIERARPGGEADDASQLIIDEDGPVMIRKNIGQPTALTLRPIAVDGIPYPAGMIVNARLAARPNQYKSRQARVDVIEVSEVSAISPLRLSAFGLGRFRRSIDFHKLHPYLIDEEVLLRDERYMKIKLQDIGRIASDHVNGRHSEQLLRAPTPRYA